MDGKLVKVFSNNMVDMKNFVDFDPERVRHHREGVASPCCAELLEQY